ncbi:assembly of actin patch protein [Podospora pseudopauciseta]|uniref:Assembly of actin patch protein n=1 Tax=Podospora pseudopauciseta TaxID=2093780 RepID=A0ABR0I2W7_9PEZI|nr:assembly of actin patch protein [Podospora pseudopauciseta]
MSFKVKALYEYNSGHEDDLIFSVGQIITVTDEEDADWYAGEYVDEAGNKQEGIFPRNFVEKYEPAAPPRPATRPQSKREHKPAAEAPIPAPESPKHEVAPEPEPEPLRSPSPEPTISSPPPAPAAVPVPIQSAQAPASPPAPAPAPVPVAAPAPPVPQPTEAPSAAKSPPAPKPAAVVSKPSAGPPPVSDKPTGNSFKDRLALFNKAAAAPPAPFKPSGLSSGGGSSFIKKPFVAPPPSRHAYIPPVTQAPVAKVYRRDEDPEVKEQEAETLENAGKAGLVGNTAPTSSRNEGEAADDEPKPMSLKERLALLQKQQMETAARHAEAAAKKEKPKKPVKKRLDSHDATAAEGEATAPVPPPLERRDTEDTTGRGSLDESHPPRIPHPGRRRSSRGIEPNDGNEADMSGAGETTEGLEELTEKEENDVRPKHVATAAKQDDDEQADEEDEEEEEEEEEDIDPEVRRKEELRARMAKMSGGMGMPGMGIPGLFGAPAPMMPKKKKAAPEKHIEEHEEPVSPTARAPPVPMPGIPLPGLSRPPPPPERKQSGAEEVEDDEDEAQLQTPHQEAAPAQTPNEHSAPPPIPGGRSAPPPVPSLDSRPPPPPPTASAIKSPSEGSVSDDELSERPNDESDTPKPDVAHATRAPPPPPPGAGGPPPLPPTSPRAAPRRSHDESPPTSPSAPAIPRRDSRAPPPIPGAAPPLPTQSRPPPPPPTAAPPLRRDSTADTRPPPIPGAPPRDEDSGDEDEITEYEGDYDTDIASSVPHKDALKAHQRESSFEDIGPRSPTSEAPPLPSTAAPRAGPPPIPSQPPPPPSAPAPSRKSVDAPRTAPPPPPPPKEAPPAHYDDDEYDPYNYSSSSQAAPAVPSFPMPSPHVRQNEETSAHETLQFSPPPPPPQNLRSPIPPPISSPPNRAPPPRKSLDVPRGSGGRRSVDVTRPSMESGFVANDIDLANQSGWWLQPNGLPSQLHGRKDIFFESEESTSSDPHQGGKTIVTRDIYVLFQDYSQTVITVRFNPQDPSDVQLDQRHEAPPRALRQDQLEESYERFGRAIGEAVHKLKDTVVGDGTPQGLIHELLRPHKDALHPVGTRAYGALVYSNLANASTSQNDEIRPGDIISIRNAKFQGKHGAMHAKYSVEVGKPDHVAVVGEWDGTKKKVRAWEQGRESKKVKLESFKLDDLRSGEVKIWRVMPRSWIGWEGGDNGGGATGGN